MIKFEIEVAETQTIVSQAGARCIVDMTQLSNSIVKELAIQGLKVKTQRSYSGSAAGAKAANMDQAAWELDKMNAVVQSLYEGEWVQRARATGFAASPVFKEIKDTMDRMRVKVSWKRLKESIGTLEDMEVIFPQLCDYIAAAYIDKVNPTVKLTDDRKAKVMNQILAKAQDEVNRKADTYTIEI